MPKKILFSFCLTLSAIALFAGFGFSANPSGETPGKGAVPKITMLEAIKIATELVSGRVVEAELEDEKNILFYEIEMITSDGMIVEVQVDANSGQIIRQAREGEVAYINVEQAINTATEFLQWHPVGVELEEENGKAVYEIKLVNNIGDDQEVEIDALSGQVLEPEAKKPKKDGKKESENGKD